MLCIVQHRAVCAVLGICTAGHRFLQLVRANDEGRTRFAITMVSHHILRLARIRVWSCIGWLVRCVVCCDLGKLTHTYTCHMLHASMLHVHTCAQGLTITEM